MTKFIIKRLLISIVILFFVMLIVYALMYSACRPATLTETMARQLAQKPREQQKSYKEWLHRAERTVRHGQGRRERVFYLARNRRQPGHFGDSWQWYTIPVTEEFHKNDLVQLCPRPGGLHF
jgi:peptide/nickel transport system permease protein